MIVLTTLGVAEDDVLCAGALHHGSAHLTRVSTLLLVGAVLGTEGDDVLVEHLSYACQMDKRRADDDTTVRLVSLACLVDFLCQGNALLQVLVHFPVTCYDFLSHCCLF